MDELRTELRAAVVDVLARRIPDPSELALAVFAADRYAGDLMNDINPTSTRGEH
jgi:hypothetical protein